MMVRGLCMWVSGGLVQVRSQFLFLADYARGDLDVPGMRNCGSWPGAGPRARLDPPLFRAQRRLEEIACVSLT